MKLTLEHEGATVSVDHPGVVSADDYAQLAFDTAVGAGFAPESIAEAFWQLAELRLLKETT